MEKQKRSGFAYDPFIRIVAMDESGAKEFALRFFGMNPTEIDRIEDGGPARDPDQKYKPGAREYHLYTKSSKKGPPS